MGDPKILTPGPWTPLRTQSMDYLTDRSTDPFYGPPPRTSPKNSRKKLTVNKIRNDKKIWLTIWPTARVGEKIRTPTSAELTDSGARLCLSHIATTVSCGDARRPLYMNLICVFRLCHFVRLSLPRSRKMAEVKTEMKLSIFKAHVHGSLIRRHREIGGNIQLIYYLVPESVNFAEVGVRIFLDTSSQSIQMVCQIILPFVFKYFLLIFFRLFLGWFVSGGGGRVR